MCCLCEVVEPIFLSNVEKFHESWGWRRRKAESPKTFFFFFCYNRRKKFFSYFISLFNLCEQHKYRFRNVCSEYRMPKKELPWWYKNFLHIPFVPFKMLRQLNSSYTKTVCVLPSEGARSQNRVKFFGAARQPSTPEPFLLPCLKELRKMSIWKIVESNFTLSLFSLSHKPFYIYFPVCRTKEWKYYVIKITKSFFLLARTSYVCARSAPDPSLLSSPIQRVYNVKTGSSNEVPLEWVIWFFVLFHRHSLLTHCVLCVFLRRPDGKEQWMSERGREIASDTK